MVFSLTGSGKSVDIYDEFYILCMATVKLDSRAIGTFNDSFSVPAPPSMQPCLRRRGSLRKVKNENSK